ncbi:MAG: CaiB/BaiF CoA-transferase family protein [Parvularculaceae bacterium]
MKSPLPAGARPPGALPPAALDGVRVLDLSRVLAGPWATQILADLGAEVVKIERPGAGDETRAWGPPFLSGKDGEPSDAAYFLCANRNKRSICVDMAKRDGQDIIRRLAAKSGIVVENFKRGGLAKYGLDYESLRKVNPALVYCSITGFGQSGPYADRAGYDYLIQAMSGLMSVTGAPDREPVKVGVAVSDLFSGLYAAVSILAALRHAERTGEGQQIDISLLDCQMAALANQAANYLVSGKPPARLGNAHPNIVPYQVFETSDGHMVVAVGNDGQFKSFAAAIGAPELAGDARYTTNPARVANREALIATLAPILRRRETADWIAAFEAAGVPCGPINDIAAAFADRQAKERGLRIDLAREDVGAIPLVRFPGLLSATPARAEHAPPRLGAHTEEVLAEALGLAAEEIAALRRAGAIGGE